MADSITTKKALAKALKELMNETSFYKITIADICTRCNMSRKSFYYHFKDKYDLVNWIFNDEYLSTLPQLLNQENELFQDRWALIENLFCYFHSNIEFYKKVFRIKGQNSFIEYFRDLVMPLLDDRVKEISDDPQMRRFCKEFFADAFMSALERWIIEYNKIPPTEFVELMKSIVETAPFKEQKESLH